MLREYKDALSTLVCLKRKLDRFREQVRAVDRDWDSLSPINGKNLVIGQDFRPMPVESEIASTLVEIRDCSEKAERLRGSLGLPK